MSTQEQEQDLVNSLMIGMRRKLRENRHKTYWADPAVPMIVLVSSLLEEVSELVEAVSIGDPRITKSEVWSEAGDVANLAAMIADHFFHNAY